MADEQPQKPETPKEEEGRKSADMNGVDEAETEDSARAVMKESGTGTEVFEEKQDGEADANTTEITSEPQDEAETKEETSTVEVDENTNAIEEEKPVDEADKSQSDEPPAEGAEDKPEESSQEEANQSNEDVDTEKQGEIKPDSSLEGDKEESPDADGEETEVEEGEEKPTEEEKVEGEADKENVEGEVEPEEVAEGDSTEVKVTEDGEPPEEETDVTEKTEEQVEEIAEKPQTPVPESDTFAEGERTESPVAVGQKLSREPTPVRFDVREVTIAESIEPGTPDGGSALDEEEEYEEEEEEQQPEFDREMLIERYNASIAEREQLQQQNYSLQHKLAEYFRKKKSDESRQDYDKNVTDQEQRYLKYMAQLEDLRRQESQEKENYRRHIEDWKDRCEDKKSKVDDERSKFLHFKKEVALNAVNSRSGKPITPKDIEQYLGAENKKETDVESVRLENIKLKNKLKKKEQQLKSKEELAEGLHLIDFEQLKIENQTYNEKIEERNEELLKLRKKITSTVQVLTHLKEKLQFVQAENQIQKGNLRDVEAYVAQKRDVLSRTKQARDALRIDNQRLRQSCGLLGNEPLLRDYEERKDEGDDLRSKLESLKMEHAELTLNCNQVRRKIEQARNGGRA